jgi:hypothetical protein
MVIEGATVHDLAANACHWGAEGWLACGGPVKESLVAGEPARFALLMARMGETTVTIDPHG